MSGLTWWWWSCHRCDCSRWSGVTKAVTNSAENKLPVKLSNSSLTVIWRNNNSFNYCVSELIANSFLSVVSVSFFGYEGFIWTFLSYPLIGLFIYLKLFTRKRGQLLIPCFILCLSPVDSINSHLNPIYIDCIAADCSTVVIFSCLLISFLPALLSRRQRRPV